MWLAVDGQQGQFKHLFMPKISPICLWYLLNLVCNPWVEILQPGRDLATSTSSQYMWMNRNSNFDKIPFLRIEITDCCTILIEAYEINVGFINSYTTLWERKCKQTSNILVFFSTNLNLFLWGKRPWILLYKYIIIYSFYKALYIHGGQFVASIFILNHPFLRK